MLPAGQSRNPSCGIQATADWAVLGQLHRKETQRWTRHAWESQQEMVVGAPPSSTQVMRNGDEPI